MEKENMMKKLMKNQVMKKMMMRKKMLATVMTVLMIIILMMKVKNPWWIQVAILLQCHYIKCREYRLEGTALPKITSEILNSKNKIRRQTIKVLQNLQSLSFYLLPHKILQAQSLSHLKEACHMLLPKALSSRTMLVITMEECHKAHLKRQFTEDKTMITKLMLMMKVNLKMTTRLIKVLKKSKGWLLRTIKKPILKMKLTCLQFKKTMKILIMRNLMGLKKVNKMMNTIWRTRIWGKRMHQKINYTLD